MEIIFSGQVSPAPCQKPSPIQPYTRSSSLLFIFVCPALDEPNIYPSFPPFSHQVLMDRKFFWSQFQTSAALKQHAWSTCVLSSASQSPSLPSLLPTMRRVRWTSATEGPRPHTTCWHYLDCAQTSDISTLLRWCCSVSWRSMNSCSLKTSVHNR